MSTPNPTYLFYDIETSGINCCFDQILQFAAIRTNMALEEIERVEFFIRLNQDVIPSPYAMITHRIALDTIQNGQTELEAIQKIHALLNTPGTISLGYNTLGFDDAFLRFAFYRHLLSPYTHQYANGCGRMDLYPITVLYALFQPDCLTWPTHDGKPTLKLEHLNTANQLAAGQAHDAMVDIEATIALARRFYQNKKMWQYAIGYFDKKTDQQRMQPLSEALIVNGILGARNQYIAPGLNLGQHQHYHNQTLWLRLDLPDLQNTTPDNIAETTRIIKKKPAEQFLVLPPQPRFLEKISAERQAIMQENLAWLKANPKLHEAIIHFHQHDTYPIVDNLDASAALYDAPFPSPFEMDLFRQFHAAPAQEKMSIAASFPNALHQTLALRIVGRHFPDVLSDQQAKQFEAYLAQRLQGPEQTPIDYRNEHALSITQAQAEIELLENQPELDAVQKTRLRDLKKYFLSSI